MSADMPRSKSKSTPAFEPVRDALTSGMIEAVRRAFDGPEAVLALMIIRQTILDLRSRNAVKRAAALDFVHSNRFAEIVGALGLDTGYVRLRCERIGAEAAAKYPAQPPAVS